MNQNFDIPLEFLTDDEVQELSKFVGRLEEVSKRDESQSDFITFVKHVWPTFVEGNHHKIYADKLQKVAEGKIKRLIINMPPRHTKSEFASYLFPSWLMGRNPNTKVIQATHTAELAVGFGRKVKNLIDSEVYRDIFPDLALASDAKASGRWSTSKGENTMLWVLVVLWLVVVLTCVSLMTLCLNRMRYHLPHWIIYTNGIHQAQDRDSSQEDQ